MAPSTPDRPDRQPDRRTDSFVTYYDPAGSAKLSTVIAHTLSDLMGTDVRHAERVLYRCIDPVSLDRLFKRRHDGSPRYEGQTRFTVDGYTVVISAAGQITITPYDHVEE